jgi:dihydrofolate reductase
MTAELRSPSQDAAATVTDGRPAGTSTPAVALIVAMTPAGVIGRDNGLPWHLPDDLRRFKALTMGKPIVMGRRTFESIGRPLPGRRSIVLSRRAVDLPAGVIRVHDWPAALAAAADAPEVMVIGGAEVYALALSAAQRLYLTIVHGEIAGDAHFPALDEREWREIERTERPADERHAYALTYRTLERAAHDAKRVLPGGASK